MKDEKLSALYRKGSTEQPDDTIDQAVLAMAKKAVTRQRRNRIGFGLPLTAAAGLLVAVGIARLVVQQAPTEMQLDDALPTVPIETSKRKAVARPAPEPPRPGSKEERESGVLAPMLEAAPDEDGAAPYHAPPTPGPVGAPASIAKPASRKARSARAFSGAEIIERKPATQKADGIKATLNRIRSLLAQGKTDAAATQLRLLLETHPDLAIPEDLKPLILPRKEK